MSLIDKVYCKLYIRTCNLQKKKGSFWYIFIYSNLIGCSSPFLFGVWSRTQWRSVHDGLCLACLGHPRSPPTQSEFKQEGERRRPACQITSELPSVDVRFSILSSLILFIQPPRKETKKKRSFWVGLGTPIGRFFLLNISTHRHTYGRTWTRLVGWSPELQSLCVAVSLVDIWAFVNAHVVWEAARISLLCLLLPALLYYAP